MAKWLKSSIHKGEECSLGLGGCGSLLWFQPSQVESDESPEQDVELDKAY